MNIFSYGRIYSHLSVKQLESLKFAKGVNGKLLFLFKIYLFLFGYPDVASQRKFLIVEKLLSLKKGDKILDAGCGNGIYLQELGKKYPIEGFGIDARKNRIDAARKINRYLGKNDIFIASTLEKVDMGNKKFSKIICLEVLEHIVDDSLVLKKLSKCLVKNGLFIISVPMKGTGLTKNQENDPNFKPERYEHVRSGYSERELRKMASGTGLKVILIKKYFFLVSRYAVAFQQFLFKKNLVILNLLFSPLLLIISELDFVFRFKPRGYVMVLKKI